MKVQLLGGPVVLCLVLLAVTGSGSGAAAHAATRSTQDPLGSPRMGALVRSFEAGDAGALAAFRHELEASGTPLVEPIAGDTATVLVTFVWFAAEERENVVVQSWLESRTVERRAMQQVGATGLWYRTFRAPADLIMGYLISPDDARLLPAGSGNADVTATWLTDPLNPQHAPGALGMQWSVVNLSGRDAAPWLSSAGPDVPRERLVDLRIESDALDTAIPVKVLVPPGFASGDDDYPLLLFFDGFGFFDIDQAHRLVDRLTANGRIPPTVTAFIYNPDGTRNRDMSCYDPVHEFLREELIPELRNRFGGGRTAERTVIAGRSRSGLGAVCAAYTMPEVIGKAISQSGSFWWAPQGQPLEWLARDMATTPVRPITLYLDAGELEDGPSPDLGLSMLTVTRHLRDVARARGYEVHYDEFAGGHDPIGWRTTLPNALASLLGN